MRDKFDLKELTNEIPLGEFLKYDEPLLVSRTNAVSGKLLLASEMSRFDTVGYDCAAVCINDMYAMGAKPLLFYDNISCARPKFEYIRDMEEGMENGCRQGNVTYAGSEIKELSDIFSYDQYDLVGFIAGVVEKKKKIGIAPVKAGDVIIGLSSNGLHNNGYVAARKKLYLTKTSMEIYYESLGSTLGDLLLAPTRMYRDAMEALLQSEIEIKSCVLPCTKSGASRTVRFNEGPLAHGGIDKAVHTLMHNAAGAVIKQREEDIPPLYDMLHKDGNISKEQMRNIFNMGIGMLILVAEEDTDRVVELLEAAGEEPVELGLAETGSDIVRYI